MKDYKFSSRGVGLDSIKKCFVCGCGRDEAFGCMPNIAAFVDSKEDGEEIVKLFPEDSARLDYRPSEPKWIQVKIGACEKHKPALEELHRLTRSGTIYKRDIELAQIVGKMLTYFDKSE